MSQRRFRIKSKTSIIVFIVYLLISGLFLGFSAGGFIFNFKELGFSINSVVITLYNNQPSVDTFIKN